MADLERLYNRARRMQNGAEVYVDRERIGAALGILGDLIAHIRQQGDATEQSLRERLEMALATVDEVRERDAAQEAELTRVKNDLEHRDISLNHAYAKLTAAEKELDAAWGQTGVVSTVRGMTDLSDVVRDIREKRVDAQAALERAEKNLEWEVACKKGLLELQEQWCAERKELQDELERVKHDRGEDVRILRAKCEEVDQLKAQLAQLQGAAGVPEVKVKERHWDGGRFFDVEAVERDGGSVHIGQYTSEPMTFAVRDAVDRALRHYAANWPRTAPAEAAPMCESCEGEPASKWCARCLREDLEAAVIADAVTAQEKTSETSMSSVLSGPDDASQSSQPGGGSEEPGTLRGLTREEAERLAAALVSTHATAMQLAPGNIVTPIADLLMATAGRGVEHNVSLFDMNRRGEQGGWQLLVNGQHILYCGNDKTHADWVANALRTALSQPAPSVAERIAEAVAEEREKLLDALERAREAVHVEHHDIAVDLIDEVIACLEKDGR